jgi:hypothetical protein
LPLPHEQRHMRELDCRPAKENILQTAQALNGNKRIPHAIEAGEAQ